MTSLQNLAEAHRIFKNLAGLMRFQRSVEQTTTKFKKSQIQELWLPDHHQSTFERFSVTMSLLTVVAIYLLKLMIILMVHGDSTHRRRGGGAAAAHR